MKLTNAIAATYVLEDIKIDASSEPKIEITARKAGLISWIMAKLFKRISGMSFAVHTEGVTLNDGWYQWMPVKKIANVGCGYMMNTLWQVLGILALLVGLAKISSGGWPLFLLAALFFYLYSRSRRFMISLTACSGEGITFGVKRGMIGGKALADEDAEKIVGILKSLICSK